MDVDMIKSSRSTAAAESHHQNHHHHHHGDMTSSIVMQMEKPDHQHHHHHHHIDQVQLFCDPSSTFLVDVNFSEPTQEVPVLNNPVIHYHHGHHQPPSFKTSNNSNNPRSNSSSMAAMREMIFRMAAMQPVHIDPESIKPPKRRNVRISKDPQSVAARHRRERISERIRILQRLVPGGTKMDTASMLDEAIHYVKFLKTQVQTLEQAGPAARTLAFPLPPAAAAGGGGTSSCYTGSSHSNSGYSKAVHCQSHPMLR